MNRLLKVLLVFILLTSTITMYAQKSSRTKQKADGRDIYVGSDIIKDLLKQEKDTLFTRYYLGGFMVDSTALWREKVTYTGKQIAEDEYQLLTTSMLKNKETGELSLYIKGEKRFEKKKTKATHIINQKYLLDGLVEEVVHKGDTYVVKCVNAEGVVLNNKGCLRYSYTPFPEIKTHKFRASMQDAIYNVVTKSRGILPNYIILSIEADVKSKRWNLALDFPDQYNLGSDMHTSLVAAIVHVLNNEKLEEYHYDQDVNGNYYNRTMYVPIRFKK
ncbi:hypothetical protein [Myroides marinus]|uniref:hypothetical protein n=1 Tax=Myroides marinus TaxID=703342 RepID=UPI0025788DA1|nr:hypothetical protein [Myroides marinus]MDM1345961.1 hypothetical protein [Myroides marinus]MDM1353144.1 hypothetical protein [Myroides marinus]MDM1402900.1 hypothetical protein [Myroides marinus]MDM1531530.1 hypothetical protein [Myroides marinus]MDM1538322.1 hypothetical protein [Myroides marinus]